MIRNLVDSDDDHSRQTQRKKLENDLSVTSERLDSLVQGRTGTERGVAFMEGCT